VKNDKTILIFGAGKIGRSFIGQLFGQSGYNVVFCDVDQALINELNRRKSYPVVIKGKTEETILVKNVRAVSGLDHDAVIKEVVKASIMAVSVGKNALEKIIPVIAEGLKQLLIGRWTSSLQKICGRPVNLSARGS
jgi:mannitol-1-phosphate 5-dehydrogenase